MQRKDLTPFPFPRYQMRDQVGSLRALVDASGAVVKAVEYDAFGNVVSDTNPGLDGYVGFAGGLQDRDTGLVRFGYRDYLPEIGRWTARDPIGIGGGDWDLYAYCGQDPINRTDPLGLSISDWLTGFGTGLLDGVVGSVVGYAVGVIAAASLPTVAVPVLGTIAAVAGVGMAGRGLYEAITGSDLVTGCGLSERERGSRLGRISAMGGTSLLSRTSWWNRGRENDAAWLNQSPFRRWKSEWDKMTTSTKLPEGQSPRLSDLNPLNMFAGPRTIHSGPTSGSRYGLPGAYPGAWLDLF